LIKIIIKQSLVVKGLPEHIAEKVQADLTFDNPMYTSALKNGRYIPQGMPPYIYMYETTGTIMYLPKGYMNNLLYKIGKEPKEIIDHTIDPSITDKVSMVSTPRDYQELAITDILNKRYGVLEASTGAGKTLCGICTVVRRGVKTLVLVHSKELLDQWKSAFKKHTDITKIGSIGDNKFDIQDVTIGIINSVARNTDKLQGIFGQVICDECHRVVSTSWIQVLNSLNAKYVLGLSATPFRRDKLMTKGIYFMIGPKVHVVDKKYLVDTGAVLVPKVICCHTSFNVDRENMDYSSIISELVENPHRNRQIIDRVVADIQKYNEPVMIVSDRVSHCELLFILLQRYAIVKPVILIGKQATSYRKNAVAQLATGGYNAVISTTSLIGEGFDSPLLNALFICTPIKFEGRLIQSCGRILRPSKSNEDPRVYDFRDNSIVMLQRSGWNRDRVYKKAGWL